LRREAALRARIAHDARLYSGSVGEKSSITLIEPPEGGLV
jgi:hypothetical protein